MVTSCNARVAERFTWALAGLYAAVLGYASLRRHWHFRTGGYDLGIFDQGVWLLAQGSRPFATVRGRDLFADHFQPVLALLSPLAALDLTPAALLILQSAALAAAAPPLFKLARLRGAAPGLALAVAALWLASPLTQWANLFDFHPETAVPVLLVHAAIALETQHVRRFALFAGTACLFKEDIAVVFVVWGVLLAFRGMKKLGLAVTAGATAVALFGTQVVVPAFGGNFDFYTARFGGDRGSTWTEILTVIFGDPFRTIEDLATPANAKVILVLVVASGGLALLRPTMLLPAAPAILTNLLSAYSYRHELAFHYHLLPATFFAIAGAYGAGVLASLRPHWMRQTATGLVGLAAVMAVVGPATVELRREPHPSQEARETAIGLIPAGAPVAAAPLLVPHLAHRHEIYQLPEPFFTRPGNGETWTDAELRRRAERVEWVVYELRGLDPWPRKQTAELPTLLRERGFRQIFASRGVRVFQRELAGSTSSGDRLGVKDLPARRGSTS